MAGNLGEVLKLIRKEKGYSLRQAEEKTGISNAYLSQLERNIATQPSPSKLLKLSKCYDFPYDKLMRLAGYIQDKKKTAVNKNESLQEAQIALMSSGLDSKQVEKVMEYVNFIKGTKNKG